MALLCAEKRVWLECVIVLRTVAFQGLEFPKKLQYNSHSHVLKDKSLAMSKLSTTFRQMYVLKSLQNNRN